MENIVKRLKSKRGETTGIAVGLLVLLLAISAACFESYRLNIVMKGVRDAVQSTIVASCTANCENLYGGVREGYSGGYRLDAEAWTERVDTGDFYSQLDKLLKMREENGKHVKYYPDSPTEEFLFSNLSVEIENAPLAPGEGDGRRFRGKATFDIEIPLSFGWSNLPPLKLEGQVVNSGFVAKF